MFREIWELTCESFVAENFADHRHRGRRVRLGGIDSPVLVHNCVGETLDRAIALHGTRTNAESTVGVAEVRPIGRPDAPAETWAATERSGLPEEWRLPRAVLARGCEPIEVGSSTNMCFE